MNEWQPIETAPRDGSYFVTANFSEPFPEDGEYEISHYRPMNWTTYEPADGGLFRKVEQVLTEFRSDNFHRATHWMPLPEPPKASP